MANVLFSLVMAGVIILILCLVHYRPLPNWMLGITPNALISIFSTLAKAAVLLKAAECLGQWKWVRLTERDLPMSDIASFDNATRGPWGSLLLLWHIRRS